MQAGLWNTLSVREMSYRRTACIPKHICLAIVIYFCSLLASSPAMVIFILSHKKFSTYPCRFHSQRVLSCQTVPVGSFKKIFFVPARDISLSNLFMNVDPNETSTASSFETTIAATDRYLLMWWQRRTIPDNY